MPPPPIGYAQKEQQPASQEFLQPSEDLPQLTKELKELGVETTKAESSPTGEHQAIGIKPAGESVPVTTQPSGIVRLPMTKEEAKQISKTHGIKDALRWLAALISRQLKIVQMKGA